MAVAYKELLDVEPAVELVPEPDVPVLVGTVAVVAEEGAVAVVGVAAVEAVDTLGSYYNTIVDTGLHKTSGFRIPDITPYFQPSPVLMHNPS